MSAYIDFDGIEAAPTDDDVIDLGLKIRTGHTGFHGLKYDVGAVRQVCTNGMVAFDSDLQLEQTHQEPLQYGMARQAVDAIVDGADLVEQRLQTAADRSFHSTDEALLGLMDLGLDAYFEDDAVSLLRESLETELEEAQDAPTLYDTYNAATRALTHHAELSPTRRDDALEQAARLLDQHGQVPDPEPYAQDILERRIDAVTDDAEPYWEGEEEALQELTTVHGDDANLAG
ncbi:DUF932 domain-containing protein [Halomontanus rarus]|uniref:DUF932 domain-containing protein n=1 Tax=Halomontanus rarus TaxID=3034020 RepID=UPI001A997A59